MITLLELLLRCWPGCCAIALLEQTRLLFRLPLTLGPLEGFVFAGALYGYTASRHEPIPRAIIWLSGAFAFGFFCWMPRFAQAAALVPAAIWALYYGIRWLRIAPMRSVPILKPLAIALAWAWVTVLLPLSAEQWRAAAVLVAGRAAFVFSIAIATDICDFDYDRDRGFRTWALQLGMPRALLAFDASIALAAICVVTNWSLRHYLGIQAIALLVSLAAAAAVIRSAIRFLMHPPVQRAIIDATTVMQFLFVAAVTPLG